MAIYSLAQRTISTSAAAATWEIRTTASLRSQILEIGLSQVTAVGGGYAIGRPSSLGLSPTTPQTFIAEDAGEPVGNTVACVAWASTVPGVPANFFRRVFCPATIGAGVIWTFPRGLIIAVSSSLVLWVIATAPVLDCWAVENE
jgi:hypothetical protein